MPDRVPTVYTEPGPPTDDEDLVADARPAAVRIAVVVDDRGDPDWHGQPVLDYWLDQQ
jgi:hypothetical protein